MKYPADKFFIYKLVDPRTGEPRYVGQTSAGMTRPLAHKYPSVLKKRTPHFRNWVNSMSKMGVTYEVVILERFSSAESLNDAETQWIKLLRSLGACLINYTDGGGGIRGFRHSPSTRNLIAESNRRRKGEHREYERTEAQKIVTQSNQPKAAAARRGVPPSQAAVEALTKFARTPRSPQHRANIAKALRGKPKSAEHVRNSVTGKQRHRDAYLEKSPR